MSPFPSAIGGTIVNVGNVTGRRLTPFPQRDKGMKASRIVNDCTNLLYFLNSQPPISQWINPLAIKPALLCSLDYWYFTNSPRSTFNFPLPNLLTPNSQLPNLMLCTVNFNLLKIRYLLFFFEM